MDVFAAAEGFDERLLAAEVGQNSELDLGVVGREEAPAGSGTKASRIRRPSSVRMGMFWRLGEAEESRPVAVTSWLKDVWIRPVTG